MRNRWESIRVMELAIGGSINLLKVIWKDQENMNCQSPSKIMIFIDNYTKASKEQNNISEKGIYENHT